MNNHKIIISLILLASALFVPDAKAQSAPVYGWVNHPIMPAPVGFGYDTGYVWSGGDYDAPSGVSYSYGAGNPWPVWVVVNWWAYGDDQLDVNGDRGYFDGIYAGPESRGGVTYLGPYDAVWFTSYDSWPDHAGLAAYGSITALSPIDNWAWELISPSATFSVNKGAQRNSNTVQLSYAVTRSAAAYVTSSFTGGAIYSGGVSASFPAALQARTVSNFTTFNLYSYPTYGGVFWSATLNVAAYMYAPVFQLVSLDQKGSSVGFIRTRLDVPFNLSAQFDTLTETFNLGDPGEVAADVRVDITAGGSSSEWINPALATKAVQPALDGSWGWLKQTYNVPMTPNTTFAGATHLTFTPFYKAVRTSGAYANTPDPATAISMMSPGVGIDIFPLASPSLTYITLSGSQTIALPQTLAGPTSAAASGEVTDSNFNLSATNIYPDSVTVGILQRPDGSCVEVWSSTVGQTSISSTFDISAQATDAGAYALYIVCCTPIDRVSLSSLGINVASVSSGAPVAGGNWNPNFPYGWVALSALTFTYDPGLKIQAAVSEGSP